jgi:hypothetical protein
VSSMFIPRQTRAERAAGISTVWFPGDKLGRLASPTWTSRVGHTNPARLLGLLSAQSASLRAGLWLHSDQRYDEHCYPRASAGRYTG